MKVETLLLALVSQLIQVGHRSVPSLFDSSRPQISPALHQNVTFDCHCYCITGNQDFGESAFILALVSVGSFCLGRFFLSRPSGPSGSPSPRRRGNGVLVEHSTWVNPGCVLL